MLLNVFFFKTNIQQMVVDYLAINSEQAAFEYLAVKAGLGSPAVGLFSLVPIPNA